MTPLPSQRTIDLVVECEVSSRAYYEKHYQRPEWPGGASGVTIGIGYDLGYASQDKIRRDWGRLVDTATLAAMLRCSGITGGSAHSLLSSVRGSIFIPWDLAQKVFINTDVPEYIGGLIKAVPGAEYLPADCLGILFSIAYNRGNGGWTSSKDRYREMHAIRGLVQSGELDLVGVEIRKMCRLWPSDDKTSPDRGLRARRLREAALWEKGLKASEPPALAIRANPEPPKSLPAPPTGAAEQGSAGGTILATGGAAKAASDAGWSHAEVLAVVLIGLAIAILVGVLINRYRASSNPTLARQKDPEATA